MPFLCSLEVIADFQRFHVQLVEFGLLGRDELLNDRRGRSDIAEAGFLEETLTQADLVSWGPHECPDFTSFFPQTTCFSKKYKKNKSSRDGVRVEKIYSKKGKWKVKCCVVPASSCGSRCCQK